MSKTPKRIYLVADRESSTTRLVRATNPSQAIRHVAQRFAADVASQDDLVALLATGTKVEDAGEAAQS